MAPLAFAKAISVIATCLTVAHAADRALYSTQKTPQICISDSVLTAESFGAAITPDNQTLTYSIYATIDYSGQGFLGFALTVNSDVVYNATMDPCSSGYAQLCPISKGQINLITAQGLTSETVNMIPDEAYTSQDLDADFKILLYDGERNEVGCLQTNLTNGIASQTENATQGARNETSVQEGDATGNASESTNGTDGTGDDESGANTTYLSWTLLVSAVFALTCGIIF